MPPSHTKAASMCSVTAAQYPVGMRFSARRRYSSRSEQVHPLDADDRTPTPLERKPIPFGLRCLQPAERERFSGDGNVVRGGIEYLQKVPRRRSTLVQLTGRVEIA